MWGSTTAFTVRPVPRKCAKTLSLVSSSLRYSASAPPVRITEDG
jgi:hypothetical protein